MDRVKQFVTGHPVLGSLIFGAVAGLIMRQVDFGVGAFLIALIFLYWWQNRAPRGSSLDADAPHPLRQTAGDPVVLVSVQDLDLDASADHAAHPYRWELVDAPEVGDRVVVPTEDGPAFGVVVGEAGPDGGRPKGSVTRKATGAELRAAGAEG